MVPHFSGPRNLIWNPRVIILIPLPSKPLLIVKVTQVFTESQQVPKNQENREDAAPCSRGSHTANDNIVALVLIALASGGACPLLSLASGGAWEEARALWTNPAFDCWCYHFRCVRNSRA